MVMTMIITITMTKTRALREIQSESYIYLKSTLLCPMWVVEMVMTVVCLCTVSKPGGHPGFKVSKEGGHPPGFRLNNLMPNLSHGANQAIVDICNNWLIFAITWQFDLLAAFISWLPPHVCNAMQIQCCGKASMLLQWQDAIFFFFFEENFFPEYFLALKTFSMNVFINTLRNIPCIIFS